MNIVRDTFALVKNVLSDLPIGLLLFVLGSESDTKFR
jgi:hypothetical protein